MIAKLSLAINILLVIAVAYLFLKKPGSDKTETPGSAPTITASAFTDTAGVRAPIVAYVNGDSINARYKFIVEKSAALQAGMKKADGKVRAEYEKRQREAAEMMTYAQSKQLPEDEQMIIQQRLAQLEQEMAEIEEKETGGLMKKEQELQKDLQVRVSNFLRSYAQQKGIDYVLNYQEGIQLVLYGNEAYDVTSEVINGLNSEYEKEKEKK